MGIINTIKRSEDDLVRPKHKNYLGYLEEILDSSSYQKKEEELMMK